MSLCKYKYSLGEPGKGVHSYRFFGVAIMDVIITPKYYKNFFI